LGASGRSAIALSPAFDLFELPTTLSLVARNWEQDAGSTIYFR